MIPSNLIKEYFRLGNRKGENESIHLALYGDCVLYTAAVLTVMASINLFFEANYIALINAVTLAAVAATGVMHRHGVSISSCALAFCGSLYLNVVVVHSLLHPSNIRAFLFVGIILTMSLALLERKPAKFLALGFFPVLCVADYLARLVVAELSPTLAKTVFYQNMLHGVISVLAALRITRYILDKHRRLFSIFQIHLEESMDLVSARSALLSLVILDLRLPVANIASEVLHLSQHAFAPSDRKKLDKLVTNSSRMGQILDTVKSIRDGGGDSLEVETQAVPVYACMEEALDILEHKARDKNIKFKLNGGKEGDLYVQADKNALCLQVFQNILSNAIKFSQIDGEIIINFSQSNGVVEISIVDQGIGMSKTLLGDIFKICAPTTRIGTGGELGTGFGLPIVKNFMDAFEGDISVSSVEAVEGSPKIPGTTFTLSFKQMDVPEPIEIAA